MNNQKIEKIDKLILEAVKEKNTERVSTLRLIKAKFMEFLTAKNAKPLDDINEIQILKKMANERKESIKIYEEAGRNELATKEKNELSIISEFLPKEPTDEEIMQKIKEHIELGIEPIMKNMGILIKCVKEAYPGADGSKVSQLVKQTIDN